MPSLRLALVFVVLAGALHGCSGEETASEPSTTGPVRAPVERTGGDASGIRLEAVVKVVDGDLGRPVRRALVRIAGEAARSDSRGVARVSVAAPGRVRARLSARFYIPRTVAVSVGRRDQATVRLWQRALQWPLYGATPARTQAHLAIRLRPPFRRVWRRDLEKLLEFPAVVWEGVAYISNIRSELTALSMRDGRVLWRNRIGRVSASSPAVDAERGQLIVTTKKPGQVAAVAMETGKVRWRRKTARVESSPIIAHGVVYFGDDAGRMYALDLERKKIRWVFSGGAKITGSPALVGRRLYYGDYAGRVFALDRRNGRRLWTGSAGGRVYGTAAVAKGRVFVPSVFAGLSALSARTGRLLWRIPVGAYLYSSPAYYRGRVYFGTYAARVYAASARSGRIVWSRPAHGRVSGAVVVVAGVVYAGTLENRITGWHWRGGRTVWTFGDGKYVPVSGNGARLLMHGNNEISAVVPKRRR